MQSHTAYEEKDLLAIEQRKKKYDNFLYFSRKFVPLHSAINSFKHLLFPAVSDISILENLVDKLLFALPNTEKISIIIPISKVMNINSVKKYDYISYISEQDIATFLNTSIVLIHNMDAVEDLDFFKDALRVEIIDKEYFSNIEAETLRKLYYKTISPEHKREYSESSKENFMKFRKKNILKKQAFCFTTGPSFDEYKSFNFAQNSLKIICNSIVKNHEFIDFIGDVDMITFGDPVFHFGPSSYAKTFREDVLKLVKSSEAYVAIPEINVPLMLFHYPELQDRLIGLGGGNGPFNFPSKKNFFIRNTSNILTLLMLPIASAISDTIFIIGADGRKEDEKYFWEHSSNVQYNSKMEDAFQMHPSFFRDRNYKDYYSEHCAVLEDLLHYGESLGKIYASITESYIPALKKRKIDFTLRLEDLFFDIEERREANQNPLVSVDERELKKQERYDFSLKMNILYSHIRQFKDSNCRIALYGNGLVCNLIAREIQDQLVVIFDQNSQSMSEFSSVHLPSEISQFSFDILVITVLGREDEIRQSLALDEKKIYILDLSRNAKKDARFIFLDQKSDEFYENNLCGPYTRNSQLSFDETKLICEYLHQNSGVMFDIGAHFGSSAKVFLEKNWYVYGYEPDPENRKKLKFNLQSYPKMIISDKAVSDQEDNILDFYSSAESSGVSSLIAFSKEHEKVCSVETTTLAQELQLHSIHNVDFLKIDTEGYDLMVLKGFPWEKTHPAVIECEYEDFKTKQLGYGVSDTINFLLEKEYHIYISEWHPIVRYGIQHQWKRFFKYNNNAIHPQSWGNILAFKDAPDEEKLVKNLYSMLLLEAE